MDLRRYEHALTGTRKPLAEKSVDPAGGSRTVKECDAEVEGAANEPQCVVLGATFGQAKSTAAAASQSYDAGNKSGPAETNIFHASEPYQERIAREDGIPMQSNSDSLFTRLASRQSWRSHR